MTEPERKLIEEAVEALQLGLDALGSAKLLLLKRLGTTNPAREYAITSMRATLAKLTAAMEKNDG